MNTQMTASPVADSILKTWKEVFLFEDIDYSSDFFDLGGNSLTAGMLQAAIRKQFGVVIRTADILNNPTVTELAQKIEAALESRQQELSTASQNIIPLQPRGNGRPFFVISQSMIFRNLARKLGTAQPVYTVLMNEEDPVSNRSSLEEIIEFHLQRIRILQPKGPYRLAGWCASGWLAYGMARRLEQQGEKVEMLVVIDAIAPDYLSHCGWSTMLNYTWHRYKAARKTTSTLNLVLKRLVKPEKSEEDTTADILDATAAGIQSMGPLAGTMLLFTAKDDPIDCLPGDKGWSSLLQRSIDAIPLPGNHHKIFDVPGAEIMAKRILAELNLNETAPVDPLNPRVRVIEPEPASVGR